jgi:hypothetical protein
MLSDVIPITHPQLPLHRHTVFVGMESVRAVLGLDTERVLARVDTGHFRWVFDLGGGGGAKRELRFWVREIILPGTHKLGLPAVIRAIIGDHLSLRRGELERQWLLSHVTVARWIARRQLALQQPGRITRESVEQFLISRWVGRL